MTKNPTKVDISRTVVPQCQWYNFDTVSSCLFISLTDCVNKVEFVLTGNSIDGAEGKSKQELAY